MNDVLKQEEIDELLSKEDSESIMDQDPAFPREYDFSIQPGLLQHRFYKIEKIYERFMRKAKVSLLTIMKKTIELNTKPMTLVNGKDFLSALSVPTNINILKLNPLKGNAIICFDAYLVYTLVENYFGGDGKIQGNIERRNFTLTEYRIIDRVLKIILPDLNAAWEEVHNVKYETFSKESDPNMITWIQPHEFFLIKKIRVELEGGGGDITFALPVSMLDPIKSKLENNSESTEKMQNNDAWMAALQHEILEASVDIGCILAKKKIKIKDVVNFKSDDIIPIEISDISLVKINGIPVYNVKFGTHEGNYAVKIVGKFDRK
ncbi:MAG: flagellar motor switch protein FliM [Candidatus Berkiella sp.]